MLTFQSLFSKNSGSTLPKILINKNLNLPKENVKRGENNGSLHQKIDTLKTINKWSLNQLKNSLRPKKYFADLFIFRDGGSMEV
jgi:hypothetical protein